MIKEAGIKCVVAKSYARIFYRNSFNIGLCLIEADTKGIRHNDKLSIDLNGGNLKDINRSTEIKIKSIPEIMQVLLHDGGLVKHFKKHKGLKV